MNFLKVKGIVPPKRVVEAVLFHGPSGWKLRAYYLAKVSDTYDLGSGTEILSNKEAQELAKERLSAWISKQKRQD